MSIMSDFNSDRINELTNVKEHEQIKSVVNGLRIQMDANFEVMTVNLVAQSNKIDMILTETRKTNGRVTKIEDETIPSMKKEMNNELGTVKFFKKHKVFTGLVLLGALYIYDQFSKVDLVDKIISLIF